MIDQDDEFAGNEEVFIGVSIVDPLLTSYYVQCIRLASDKHNRSIEESLLPYLVKGET